MKKIILFLLLVIPLVIAVTQENGWPNSSVDILKEMERTTDQIYLDYFKNRIDKSWVIVDERGNELGWNFRYIGTSFSDGHNDYGDFQHYLRWDATRDPVGQAIDRAVAEAERRGENTYKARNDALDDARNKFKKAVNDYNRALRERNNVFSDIGRYRNSDLHFLDAIRPIMESAEDPQYIEERLQAARVYSNNFEIGLDVAFLNHDKYKAEVNERQIKWKQRQAAQERNKKLIGFGITSAFLILFMVIYNVKKKREGNKPSDVPEITLAPLPKNENKVDNTEIALPENKISVVNVDELLQLNNLLKEGAITQEEYDKIKSKFLEKYN